MPSTPICGCAAALASLDIFAQDDILVRNRATALQMAELAAAMEDHPNLQQVRQTGMIVAFELGRDRKTAFNATERRGLRAYRAGLERGVLLRPLGDILYWMPPYCIRPEELALLADATQQAIEEACR